MEWDKIAVGLCAFPFVPIVDGDFLPTNPATILASGHFPRREILVGTNQDEGSYFLIYYLLDLLKLTENVSMRMKLENGTDNLKYKKQILVYVSTCFSVIVFLHRPCLEKGKLIVNRGIDR